jgi:hypothetical protein
MAKARWAVRRAGGWPETASLGAFELTPAYVFEAIG